MFSSFGNNIKVTIYGGSHEPQIGVDVEGIPQGMSVDMTKLQAFLNRRAPGNNEFSTPRKEADKPIFTSGLSQCATGQSITSGDKISAYIENTNTFSRDYNGLTETPRPGHADYTARLRYGDSINMAGGGPFSGRMTAPLCIVGGIAKQILENNNIYIGAHISSIHGVKDSLFDPVNVKANELSALAAMDFPVIDRAKGEEMKAEILTAKEASDSVGGTIECCAVGVPAGLGGAMYDGIESLLAPIFFGIPAVKGVDFGRGFGSAELLGSENNDAFCIKCLDKPTDATRLTELRTVTNNHGGILGGISSGMPIIAKLAFKPTPSIGKKQQTVNLSTSQETTLQLGGRHDPCVVLRAVPVVEAAMAVGLLDLFLNIYRSV